MDTPTVQVTERANRKSFLPGIAGAVQTGLGFFGNLMRQKHEERMAQEQRNWNLEQWHRQNQYNSPEAQLERLKAAGLNPHLLYGQGVKGATGQADAVQGYDPASSVDLTSGVAPFSQYQSFRNAQVNNDLRIATQRYMETKEDNQILRYNSDALELKAQGLHHDLKGNFWHGDQLQNQVDARAEAIFGKNQITRINYELASVTKEDRAKLIQENATRAYWEGLSAQEQYYIKKQFLKAGPYSATEATINTLMIKGMSYDNARMLAPTMVGIAKDPFKVVTPSIGAFTKSASKFKKQRPITFK